MAVASIDITALKTEIDTDPLARGYASMSNIQIVESLNTIGGATADISRAFVTAHDILKEVKQADWHAIAVDNDSPSAPAGNQSDPAGAGQARALLFNTIVTAAASPLASLDWTDPQIRTSIRSCFPATHMVTTSPTTRENIIALETVPAAEASRSEELFGHQCNVSLSHVRDAKALP